MVNDGKDNLSSKTKNSTLWNESEQKRSHKTSFKVKRTPFLFTKQDTRNVSQAKAVNPVTSFSLIGYVRGKTTLSIQSFLASYATDCQGACHVTKAQKVSISFS